MRSRRTRSFTQRFAELPGPIQRQAREAYRLFASDPFHASLRLKQVHASSPFFAVRIGRDYRAVGLRQEDVVIWFWIGSHADYDQLLRGL